MSHIEAVMAKMPVPENPYNYQDLFDCRVAYWEGSRDRARLLAEEGWVKLPSAAEEREAFLAEFALLDLRDLGKLWAAICWHTQWLQENQ